LPRRRAFHERADFDRVLIGYFSDAPDGFLVGAHAASVTERLSFLLAPSGPCRWFRSESRDSSRSAQAWQRLPELEQLASL